MKWLLPLLTIMGWTDDPDEEGLVEENPFIFIIIGIVGAIAVSILHFVGIEYQPGWFEGQNLISTMGIIFLIIFIPAIAISTLTGRSDLVKWEAIFLFASVFMILVGNGFDFSKFLASFDSAISSLGDTKVSQILMATLIIILIGLAFAVGTGHKVGMGAIMLIIVLLIAIGLVNLWNAGTFDNLGQYINEKGIWYAIGKAISDFTGGLAAGKAGAAIGVGCLVIGILMVLIPSWSTPVGILLIIIGAGITGTALWDQFWGPLLENAAGKNGTGKQLEAWGTILAFAGATISPVWFLKRIIAGKGL